MSTGASAGGRWLIYALGGGLGHLTRAVALARAARAWGRSTRVLTNSPFAASLPLDREAGVAFECIDPALGRDAVALLVGDSIGASEFDVLVVDTFPRGLGGELVPWLDRLEVPRVLIHRDLDPSYARWADLRTVAARYDLIILPGEDAPLGTSPHAARTAPWLLRDRAELFDRAEARVRLGLSGDDRPAVVVVGSGRPEEVESARLLASRLDSRLADAAAIRFASPINPETPERPRDVAIWPLLEVAAGIDVLVGSGGYNTVYEARATATPLVALSRPRRYDRQHHRLLPFEHARDEDDVLRLVSEHLARRTTERRVVPTYVNGVHKAVSLIEGQGRRVSNIL